MKMAAPPMAIAEVLRRLIAGGFEAYLVGGCVRDVVLDRPVHDYDVATSARPDEVAHLFEKTVHTGERFGTISVILPEHTVEVTTFRTDGDYHDARRPESVEFVTELEEDLRRRDFTINAMAATGTGEVYDPFGGLLDLKARIIRCVGDPTERFTEDALRMFRAFRFSAELGFAIEPGTLAAIGECADLAQKISAERIRDEFEKTLRSPMPEVAYDLLRLSHPDINVHNTKLLKDLAKLSVCPEWLPTWRWCAFAATLRNVDVEEFLRGLRLPARVVKDCATAITLARAGFPDDRAGIKRLLAKHGEVPVTLCAAVVYGEYKKIDEIVKSGECYALRDLAVTGGDLVEIGMPPGPEIGETLERLLDYVIENPKQNNWDDLIALL